MPSILRPFTSSLNPGEQVPVGAVVDWAHPLANGLAGCYLPGLSGVNLAGVDTLTYDTSAVLSAAREGPGPAVTTASQGLHGLAPASCLNWTAFSVYCRYLVIGAPSSGGDANPQLATIAYNNANTSPFAVAGVFASGGAALSVEWNTAGTFTSSSFVASPWAANKLASIGATFLVNGNVNRYVAGLNDGSSAFGAAGPTSSATSQVSIGSIVGQTGAFVNGICFCAYFWNRVLSDAEMQWIDQDPYCFLSPAEGEMPAFFAAAVAPPPPTPWLPASRTIIWRPEPVMVPTYR